ncbi:hypothetical protein TNCV_2308601 [Trichonephila clavipes]|nr:hypothetical protein TNCV_2308601 [Trichonephila clavipes]
MDRKPSNVPLDKSNTPCPGAVTGLSRLGCNTPPPVSCWIGEQTRYLLWKVYAVCELLLLRQVTAATMAGYKVLSEFERCVIVGGLDMEHCIFEVAMKFGFSRTTISRVYHVNIRNSVKHQIYTTSLLPENDRARAGSTTTDENL